MESCFVGDLVTINSSLYFALIVINLLLIIHILLVDLLFLPDVKKLANY